MPSKRKSAAELAAELATNHEFQREQRQREAALAQRLGELEAAEEPLVHALHAAGIAVPGLREMFTSKAVDARSVPVLVSHFDQPYPAGVRERIARILARAKAPDLLDWFIERFRVEKDRRVKDGLAAAIAGVAGKEDFGSIAALLQERTNGPSRLLLLSVVEKTTLAAANALLEVLAKDPELAREVRATQKRLERRGK